ncbi:hypothetical protein [Roseateles koreensis]|uniref:Uncharacterized protein n=1 Tax=Roseateles koreensis TaxID=2987526 RepID=A0ABT5KLZ5_9BURK|nr:hypothetical protein [Roseateles koreensis]MDC8783930.1 hypothetical protein [Roseateles koreensis]
MKVSTAWILFALFAILTAIGDGNYEPQRQRLLAIHEKACQEYKLNYDCMKVTNAAYTGSAQGWLKVVLPGGAALIALSLALFVSLRELNKPE